MHRRGNIFDILTNPLRFIGDNSGRLCGVECIKMELGEPDQSGRARPIPKRGSEFIMDIDVAIIAIGNGSNPICKRVHLICNAINGAILLQISRVLKTSVEGVFCRRRYSDRSSNCNRGNGRRP
jgi:glutamate synthase (NADPH/NADH) small chain